MHNHAHTTKANLSTLYVAAALTLSFALVEAGAGWWSNSLALMSDAGHMLADASALLIASLGAWFAYRQPTNRFSYGLGKAEFIAAFCNGLLMLVVVTGIVYHAVERIFQPLEIRGEIVTSVAFVGLMLNVLVLYLLGHGETDLNRRAAMLHVMGDLLASVAALVSGLVILSTGWVMVDPVLSLVIVTLILFSTFRLLREAVHGLLSGVPLGLSLQSVGIDMAKISGVASVHDLHVWSITSKRIALSAHVVITDISQWPSVLKDLQIMLRQAYGIEHVTLQPEIATKFMVSTETNKIHPSKQG